MNMKLLRMTCGRILAALTLSLCASARADKTVLENLTLDLDENWCAHEMVTIPEGVVVDLNGHRLSLMQLSGGGRIIDTASYEILASIKASGTQFINTGYTPIGTDRIEMGVRFDKTTGNQALWCARMATVLEDVYTAFLFGNQFRFDHYAQPDYFTGPSVKANEDYAIVADGSTLDVTINGETYEKALPSAPTPAFTADGPLMIFMSYYNDIDKQHANFGSYTLYYFRVVAPDGTSKLDLVPARRPSDKAVGLLDRVTGNFHVNGGTGSFTAGSTVTAADAGELHVNVPAGVTATCGQNTLTGGFKLVKEGAGTLVTGGTMAYWGGTQIDGGMVRVAADNATIGASGSEITVGPGATLEMDGKGGFCKNTIVLAGGTLQNTGGDVGADKAQVKSVRLTADSTMNVVGSYGFINDKKAAATLALGGYELTVDVAEGKSFWFDNVDVTAGKLTVTGEGSFAIDATSLRGAAADFELACAAVTAAVNGDVGGWAVGANTAVSGAGTVTIHGTYSPIGDAVSKYVLADGATIDLSSRSAAFDITGKSVTFATGAAFKVNVGERTLAPGERLISWSGVPSGASFSLVNPTSETDNLLVRGDGLAFFPMPAYATIDPATGEWTFFTASGVSYPNWEEGVTADIEVRFSSKAEYDAIKAAGVAPSRYVLTSLDLTADADLSQGFDFTVAKNVTIDLKGHALHLPAKTLEESASLTITDTDETGYDVLDSIKPVGNQYINTGYTPIGTDRIEMGVKFNKTTGNQALWCARMNDIYSNNYTAFLFNDKFRFDHYAQPADSMATPVVKANVDYAIVADGSTLDVIINGTTYPDAMPPAPTPAFTADGPLMIFMSYYNDIDDRHANFGSYTLYYFRVVAPDGTLKLDLVPARRLSDKRVGMLNRVNGNFHNGDFTAGNNVVSCFGAKGELHVNVSEGSTASFGASNTLAGRLKLVKEGAGTFVPGGTLTYSGGTQINGGTVVRPSGVSFGASGSEVEVGPGAILEASGYVSNPIVLAGGTLRSTNADTGRNVAQLASVRLTSDSTMNVVGSYGLVGNGSAVTTLYLGDHELTVNVAAGKSFWFDNVDVTAGKLTVAGEGTFAINAGSLRGSTADFDLACAAVTAAVNCDVHDWIVGANTAVSGAGTVTIHGAYRPNGDSVTKYVLANGATLDLSDRSTVFDIKEKNIAFADGATICVKPQLNIGGLVVPWTQPANFSDLTFVKTPNEMGLLTVGVEGISIRRGLAIFIR